MCEHEGRACPGPSCWCECMNCPDFDDQDDDEQDTACHCGHDECGVC